MNELKAMILALLKSWPTQKRHIEQLRFEMDRSAFIGEKEIIESLALGGCPPGERGIPNGGISNKTMTIALKYQDIRHRMMGETLTDILSELRLLEAEVGRLEYYISFLDDKQANILRALYLEQKSWSTLESELQLSKRTISNYRNDAVNRLVEMYSYLESVKNKTPSAE